MDYVLKGYKWKSLPKQQKQQIMQRSQTDINKFYKKVSPIIEAVKKKGDDAVVAYNKKFDNVDIPASSLRVKPEEFKKAEQQLSEALKKSINIAYKNILHYHRLSVQKNNTPFTENSRGILIKEQTTPIESVGMYVPRGKGSFPSMVYMLGVPAKLAQVPRRVMVTPPLPDGTIDPACLYTAQLCNIHEVYKVGGAQSIAALTFGTKAIPAVKKILGPGSAFVNAAKHYVSTYIDTGTPAGPSESVIIADGTTSAELVAYDLCIEAEHGPDSMAVLITHKKDFAQQVTQHLIRIIEEAPSPQKEILITVFKKYKGILITDTEQETIDLCNEIAPEHLMIHAEQAASIATKIIHAGEILLGKNTPFSLANYAAGANAILPTGGLAHSYSPISVQDFTKKSSVISITNKGFEEISPHVQNLAQYEGFYFHEKALAIRNNKKNPID